MKTKIYIAILALATLASCKKTAVTDPSTSPSITNINDINVPAGFTWQTARNINFKISVTDTRFGTASHVISLYDADPQNGGKLLAKGSASTTQAFNATVYLDGNITKVYIVKTSPDKSTLTQIVQVTNTDVVLSIGATDPTISSTQAIAAGISLSGSNATQGGTTTDCSSGCTVPAITTSNTNINVNSGDVVCITGSNITVGFNANGGTVRICGTNVTVQNANLNNNASLIVTSSGSATFANLNVNGTSSSIQNSGSITVSGSFSPGGVFQNDGTLITNGDFNLNGNSTFTNTGSVTVNNGSMNVNSTNITTNSGFIVTSRDFTLNGGSTFVNNCSVYAKGNFNDNGVLKNYNLVKTDNTSTINGGGYVYLVNSAELKTKDMMLNGTISGSGSTSVVKVTGSTTINGGGVVQNNVQYCADKGIAVNNGKFTGGATQDCSVYIPVTSCNTEGNGSAAVVDTDGDGVPDNLDDYPNDATKAFNNYNPSSTGAMTLAFEDQWPSKADFDMNDLVVSYQYTVVTNAKNVVVQVKATYNLLATGGSLGNGFGVEFPIPAASMTNLTGATQESGQDKAVIILFSNMRYEMAQWNTIPGVAQSPVKTYNVSFDVVNGPVLKTFGMDAYNPFIWNYGLGQYRGREIHLPGKTPTNLADTKLFGTQDDATNPSTSTYYVTKKGLPYAINVPAPFAYPVEYTDITKAYLHLGDWAQSGGTQYTDWYSNTATDYRNTANIYTK